MLNSLAVIICAVTSIALLVSMDWRWTVGALAAMYVAVLILVSATWPLGMAITKLVVGWMAGAALGLSQMGQRSLATEGSSWPASRIFRLLAAGLVMLMIAAIVPKAEGFLVTVGTPQIWGGFILLGMGLLQLGMTAHPFRVIIGLLTVLAGFEILYAAVEISVLVAGLLSAVNLGLALVGVYLLNLTNLEEPS
ncbi:MAG TPA: hypothetical protein VHO48_13695 [Anaerolineaceae bacterium]|nr:hypothetical protein [Anaerolineaceae bacterium]